VSKDERMVIFTDLSFAKDEIVDVCEQEIVFVSCKLLT
jgi:hypothetical protein